MNTLDGSELGTLRLLNESAVLELLYADPDGLSVSQLAASARLSRPTVEAALDNLIGRGWVSESEPVRAPRAGRPAKRYSFQARWRYIVGIDLGPHGIGCSIADLRGQIRYRSRREDLELTSTQAALDVLVTVVAEAAAAVGASVAEVGALTIALPAVVAPDGAIARTIVVPQWQRDDLVRRVRERFPNLTVRFENDAKLATAAELEYGLAGGVPNLVNILVGRRLAAGVVIDGALIRGQHGSAGEIGALPAVNWMTAHERLGSSPREIQDTIAAVHRGEEAAKERFAEFARALAPGISALCLIVDPGLVVIGGSLAGVGAALIDPLRRELAEVALFPVELRASQIGKDAVALGAVAHGLEHIRREVLSISPTTRAVESGAFTPDS